MNKYRVAELRKKRGWTQEVLAEKANGSENRKWNGC